MPRLRVVLGKTGLDGHDRGVKVIARMLRDAGHEVIYLGRRRTVAEIAHAARDEDADVIGVSVLSGTQREVAAALLSEMEASGVDVPVVIGGTILRREIPDLERLGISAVFPVGTPLQEIRGWFDQLAASLPAGAAETG